MDEIGELGEKYVLEQEKIKLMNVGLEEHADKVSDSPAKKHENGYDILSYTIEKEELYIEVKATPGDMEYLFYISVNERKKAESVWNSRGITNYIGYITLKRQCRTKNYFDFSELEFEIVVYKAISI